MAVQPGGIVEDVAPGRGPVRAGGAAVAHQPPAAIVDQRGEPLGRVAPAHLDAGLEPAGDRHRQRQAAQVLAEVAAGVEGAAHGGERRLRVGIGLRHDVQVVEPGLGAVARAHQHPLDRRGRLPESASARSRAVTGRDGSTSSGRARARRAWSSPSGPVEEVGRREVGAVGELGQRVGRPPRAG